MSAAKTRRVAMPLAVLLAFGIAVTSSARVVAMAPPRDASRGSSMCAPHAAEAAQRSRLSEAVILRVMHVESRGRANAISPKGAMGCMQIMPATWRYLTRRHGLGDDPWNARFNMIGGALYLAELARRFGFPGAYAAYNAGPERYARHVRGVTTLPAETVAYMASLSGASPGANGRAPRAAEPQTAEVRWQEAGLFARAPEAARPRSSDRAVTSPAAAAASVATAPQVELFPLARSADSSPD